MKIVPPLFLVCFLAGRFSVFGYGEYADTLPTWYERAIHVLTNACRMAPTDYRDRYIGNNSILLPEKYPPVPPLYWNYELNAAARFHSVQMALVCGMTHTCNGQPFDERIREFYTKSGYIGENIAVGYRSPQQVVDGWLIDGPTAEQAAPDGNGDGHRENIMSGRFREIGCGYFRAGTGRNEQAYWCQDFGGGRSTYSYHPVPAASHLFFDDDRITFLASVYDTTRSVSTVDAVVDDASFPCELDMGDTFSGTYSVTLPAAAGCRSYYFTVFFDNGSSVRYPEEEPLVTFGEGGCDSDIAASVAKTDPFHDHNGTGNRVQTIHSGSVIRCFAMSPDATPEMTLITNCQGSVLSHKTWYGSRITLPCGRLEPGLLIMHHRYENGSVITTQTVVIR